VTSVRPPKPSRGDAVPDPGVDRAAEADQPPVPRRRLAGGPALIGFLQLVEEREVAGRAAFDRHRRTGCARFVERRTQQPGWPDVDLFTRVRSITICFDAVVADGAERVDKCRQVRHVAFAGKPEPASGSVGFSDERHAGLARDF
jgi:hypothetical protein